MRFETYSRQYVPFGLGSGTSQTSTQIVAGQGYVYPSSMQITGAVNLGEAVAAQTGSNVAGGVAAGLSTAAAIVAPVCPPCGAALALGAAIVAPITKMLKGCGQSCIQASDYANEIEPLLQQNLSNYVNAPVRYASLQANAVANFNSAFGNLLTACQNIGGQGGTQCIQDRQLGGCKWKATPWAWVPDGNGGYTFKPAGQAGSGSQCWNWVYGYLQPIQQDPGVVPDPVSSSSSSTTTSSSGSDPVSSLLSSIGAGGNSSPLILVGLALVGLYLVAGSSGR